MIDTICLHMRRLVAGRAPITTKRRSTFVRFLHRASAFSIAISQLFIGAAAAQSATAVNEYLHKMGLDDSQIASAAAGHPIVKLMPAKSDGDVVVFGVVGARVSTGDYLKHALDPGRLIVANGGRFHIISDPATSADVRDVVFDSSEYRDLKDCRRGNCNFKLPASAMKAFAEGVNWSAPDAKAQADAQLQAGMLRLINAYRSRGNDAMLTYDDQSGMRSADAFSALLGQSTDLYEYGPQLQKYLATYPSNRPTGVRDILYWSNDHLPRVRPTITLNHVVVYPSSPGTTLIARKQVYASHYFDGAFELLAAVGAGAQAADAPIYLITVRRFRFDNLPTGVLNVRGRVRDGGVQATRSSLEHERSSAERLARQ